MTVAGMIPDLRNTVNALPDPLIAAVNAHAASPHKP
jgi:hypothetical protein